MVVVCRNAATLSHHRASSPTWCTPPVLPFPCPSLIFICYTATIDSRGELDARKSVVSHFPRPISLEKLFEPFKRSAGVGDGQQKETDILAACLVSQERRDGGGGSVHFCLVTEGYASRDDEGFFFGQEAWIRS